MRNFAYKQNPKIWSEYFGHGPAKRLLQRYVLQGTEALPRAMFITGSSGLGKTSLLRLLIRSFRCTGRAENSADACGQCPACLDTDERIADKTVSDVYWVQPGGFNDEDSLKAQVKQALQAAAKGHRHTDNPSHDVLWVVFDEWQSFPVNIRNEVLMRAEVEVPGNNVCYVFLTMQEDRLGDEDRAALMRRCTLVRLIPFSREKIAEFLIGRFPELDSELASMIASKSRGSTGMALAYYDNIYQHDPQLSVAAGSYVLGYAQNEFRWQLWQLLAKGARATEIKTLVDKLLIVADPLELSRQLQSDLLRSMENPSKEQLYACSCLCQYQAYHRNSDLTSYLIMLGSAELVTRAGVFEVADGLNYSKI